MNLLAIVIVARNEERHIERCVQSALESAAAYPGTPIVVVDSASTDATCDIAQRYPVSVVALQPEWRLAAAAGRYIGTLRTSSTYILFVDGDMVLKPEWLAQGIAFMQEHPQAATVSGELEEVYLDERDQVVSVLKCRYNTHGVTEVNALGGIGLYRRAALDEVGTFNAFVTVREEAELALRLRKAGYKLFRLPSTVAVHYSPPRDTFQEVGRRYRAGYYAGFGRALYYAFRGGNGKAFAREQAMPYMYFGSYLLLGIAGLVVLVLTGIWQALGLWLLVTVVAIGANAWRKKSLKNAVQGFLIRTLMVYGALVGIGSAMRDPAQYPTDVRIVKQEFEPVPVQPQAVSNADASYEWKQESLQPNESAQDHRRLSL